MQVVSASEEGYAAPIRRPSWLSSIGDESKHAIAPHTNRADEGLPLVVGARIRNNSSCSARGGLSFSRFARLKPGTHGDRRQPHHSTDAHGDASRFYSPADDW